MLQQHVVYRLAGTAVTYNQGTMHHADVGPQLHTATVVRDGECALLHTYQWQTAASTAPAERLQVSYYSASTCSRWHLSLSDCM